MAAIMIHHLQICEFSRTPGGRFRTDGPFSGEQFREEVLWPALLAHDLVEVDLSGTLGFGSSFLEEVFGGIVRKHGDELGVLSNRLKIGPETSSYAKEALSYLVTAEEDRSRRKKAHG